MLHGEVISESQKEKKNYTLKEKHSSTTFSDKNSLLQHIYHGLLPLLKIKSSPRVLDRREANIISLAWPFHVVQVGLH